jgi:hypothetical protein
MAVAYYIIAIAAIELYCKFITVSLPERLRNGRFTSETAVKRFQKRNRHLDPEAV